jgi:hypothetical protein
MKKRRTLRWWSALVAISAVSFLFASAETIKSEAEDGSVKKQERQHNGGIVAGTLQPSLTYEKKDDGHYVFTFTVKNQTEHEQKITFTSGQKYDYILYRDGKKVTQFSEGKVFIQIYQEHVLKQGEELAFTETIGPLPKGHYTIEWWLADRNWPNAKATLTFEVK